jgi:hypothetical protein
MGESSKSNEIAFAVTPSWPSCGCDFPPSDGDVDGENLADYILDSAGIGLDDFAAEFGRINCF